MEREQRAANELRIEKLMNEIRNQTQPLFDEYIRSLNYDYSKFTRESVYIKIYTLEHFAFSIGQDRGRSHFNKNFSYKNINDSNIALKYQQLEGLYTDLVDYLIPVMNYNSNKKEGRYSIDFPKIIREIREIGKLADENGYLSEMIFHMH